MKGRVLGWSATVPGGVHTLAAGLASGEVRPLLLGDPERPESVPASKWRRMSRLSRWTLLTADPLLRGRADLATLPVILGSALGEVVPSGAFLDRMILEGPAYGSPTHFQNSVYNATAAHLAMARGLLGPTETVSAGLATGLSTLARGLEWLERAPAVLVLLADDRNPITLAAMGERATAELFVAVLLGAEGGSPIEVLDGVHSPHYGRHAALPYESRFQPVGDVAVEQLLGWHPAGGLLAHLVTGCATTEIDEGMALTALAQRGGVPTTA